MFVSDLTASVCAPLLNVVCCTRVSKIAQGGAETISRRREITPLTENVRYRGAIVRFETQKINVTLFAFIAL